MTPAARDYRRGRRLSGGRPADRFEAALACYHSPEYQHAISLRAPHSAADLIIIEGYDGPQP
jgi:hypothetical protein